MDPFDLGYLLLELLLSGIPEILLDLLMHAFIPEREDDPRHPFSTAVLLILAGAFVGWVSAFLAPRHLIRNPDLRRANLLLTPALLGWLMAAAGGRARRKGRPVTELESFVHGFGFAFSLVLTRHLLTR
jgi:hypothetical protein